MRGRDGSAENMAKIIGIDLGTTKSAVAIMVDEEPRVILNEDGSRLTFDVAARVLVKLKKAAEDHLGAEVTGAVIAVPACFDASQRQATKESGRIAGFEVVWLVDDSAAVALAYRAGREAEETLAICDLGGGKIEVSILEVGANVVKVLATKGALRVGGEDIDHQVMERLIAEIKRDTGVDVSNDKSVLQRLKDAAEQAKIELSSAKETFIDLSSYAAGGSGLRTRLGKGHMDRMASSVVDPLGRLVREALEDAGKTPPQIDKLVLVGGSTRIPRVRDAVCKLFGKRSDEVVSLGEVVAIGAALRAGMLSGEVKDLVLLDATPLWLGVGALGAAAGRVLDRAQDERPGLGLGPTETGALDHEKIERLIDAWQAELVLLGVADPRAAERSRTALRAAIRSRPGLAKLADNPVLFTMMAVVHAGQGELPDGETALCREAARAIFRGWPDTGSATSPERILEEVKATGVHLLAPLQRLAFSVHGTMPVQHGNPGDSVADISESALLEELMEIDECRTMAYSMFGGDLSESPAWARRLLDALVARGDLLVERAPQVYTFSHRAFQELFAGWHLASQLDFEVQAAKLLRAAPTQWRRAALLAAGLLAANPDLDELRTLQLETLLNELCPAAREATEALEVIGRRPLERLLAKLARIDHDCDRLRAIVEGGKHSARERVKAGRVLGYLGDPRFRDDAWGMPADDLLGFVRIPAGPFWMGSDDTIDRQSMDHDPPRRSELSTDHQSMVHELPRHQVTLPELWMARYPVTVGQWRAFVRATGHHPEPYHYSNCVDNEPVRGVGWNEAISFVRWLDGVLHAWVECPAAFRALLDAGLHVELPSEAEWEKAARGTEGRIWPWGDTWDPERTNCRKLELPGVSPVGCFPSGATPEGLQDMAGNGREWTRSRYEDHPHRPEDGRGDSRWRVLRNGPCEGSRKDTHCARRGRAEATRFGAGFGFRISLVRSYLEASEPPSSRRREDEPT